MITNVNVSAFQQITSRKAHQMNIFNDFLYCLTADQLLVQFYGNRPDFGSFVLGDFFLISSQLLLSLRESQCNSPFLVFDSLQAIVKYTFINTVSWTIAQQSLTIQITLKRQKKNRNVSQQGIEDSNQVRLRPFALNLLETFHRRCSSQLNIRD